MICPVMIYNIDLLFNSNSNAFVPQPPFNQQANYIKIPSFSLPMGGKIVACATSTERTIILNLLLFPLRAFRNGIIYVKLFVERDKNFFLN